jgi:polyphosphate kinase 2 (PPK2 family)
VLIVRVKNLVPEKIWRPRYEIINDFERVLTLGGVAVLKFFLHISKDEQKRRLSDASTTPTSAGSSITATSGNACFGTTTRKPTKT